MFRKLLTAAALLAATTTTTARADWYEASTPHFVVYSEAQPDEVRKLAERMERYDKAMRVLRGVPDRAVGPAGRVIVYFVSDIDAIQKLYGKGGKQVGGFYQARAGSPVAFVPRTREGNGAYGGLDPQIVLLHEYAHHFMYSNWSDAAFPMWYSEGFAEFNSTMIFRDNGDIIIGAQPEARAYGVVRANFLPMDRLLQPDPGKLDDDQMYVLYSRGWLLTHYLTLDANRRGQLAAYIGAINAGKSGNEAGKAFGNLGALDMKLTSYAQRPRIQTVLLTYAQVPRVDVKMRTLSGGEAAILPARIRSQRGVDRVTAQPVVRLARTIAATYPTDATVQSELAEAEFDAGNYAASEAAADRALAADPKALRALLYKGMAAGEAAKKAGRTDTATWSAIRRWYLAANKVDPENPEPLVTFYESFHDAKQAPTKNAEAGLLYAYALAPFDPGLRLSAARVLLGQGKAGEARLALRPVVYSPHGGGGDSTAGKMLAALDSGGAEAALKVLDEAEKKAEKEKDGGEKKPA